MYIRFVIKVFYTCTGYVPYTLFHNEEKSKEVVLNYDIFILEYALHFIICRIATVVCLAEKR